MTRQLRRPIPITTPLRAPASRRPAIRKRKPPFYGRSVQVAFATCVLILCVLFWAFLARKFAPRNNTKRQTFDAIVILGTPADSDGNPSPELLDRVTEGVHEYERGVAPRILMTGAAAHNSFVEADVMNRVAQSQGVPGSVIVEDTQAHDTIQNACYSAHILQSHGWRSIEVISSPSHLPRAALIFSHLSLPGLEWRMHAAPENLTPGLYSKAAAIVEVFKTARYLVWSRWTESCSP